MSHARQARAGAGTAVALGAFALSMLVTELGHDYFFPQADEATLGWHAKQILLGRTPYRDYFSFIPPVTLYGLATVFGALGATLAALRLFTAAWLTGITLAIYALARRARMPAGWAAATALLIPAAFVPFWPVPSHHWFAVGLGIGAYYLASMPQTVGPSARSPARWAAAYTLVGLSALALQTHGVVFAIAITLHLLFVLSATREIGRLFATACLGFAAPFAAIAALLAKAGALDEAAYDLFVWPARQYQQAGGANDASLVASLREELAKRAASPTLAGVPLVYGAVALVALHVLFVLLAPQLRARRARPARHAVAALLTTGAVLLLFARGKQDWAHLVLYVPTLLALLVSSVDWEHERARPWLFRGYLAAMAAVTGAHWGSTWAKAPPSVESVVAIDADYFRYGPPRILELLTAPGASPPPVVSLPYGSSMYFYWAPEPPPIELLLPLSSHYNAPWEFAVMATFLDERRIPFVNVEERYRDAYLDDPSPLATVLRTRYRERTTTVLGVLYERVP